MLIHLSFNTFNVHNNVIRTQENTEEYLLAVHIFCIYGRNICLEQKHEVLLSFEVSNNLCLILLRIPYIDPLIYI